MRRPVGVPVTRVSVPCRGRWDHREAGERLRDGPPVGDDPVSDPRERMRNTPVTWGVYSKSEVLEESHEG
jgi:hypothetical protein